MENWPTVLIDDLRSFRHERPALILRSAAEAEEWLGGLTPKAKIGELWLDHDLGVDKKTGLSSSIMGFVNLLEEKAYFSQAPKIEKIFVHTSNPTGGASMVKILERYYPVLRVNASTYFVI